MSRRIARVLCWGLLGLVALVCAALVAAQLVLRSAWGREQLRAQVNRAASEGLSARFEIERIDTASLWFVSGSGVRLTQGQERIASLQKFAIHFNLLALFGKRIEVTTATLDQPYLDLGAPLDQGGGGLLGLLEQSAKAAPATESASSTLVLALHRVRIRSGRVEATRSGARFALTKLETRASIDIGSKLEARVDWLALEVLRNGESIAAVRGSQLRYGGSGAIGGRLRLEMPTTQISVALQVGAPGALGGRRVYAKVFAQQVSPESLAAFGVNADWLKMPVDLALNASGTTRDCDFDAWLSTAGGNVQLTGRLSQAERITATLSTAGLDTRRVLRDGLEPLAVTLEIDGNAAHDFSAAEVALELRDGSYANLALPHTELRGRWSRTAGFVLERLTARDPDAGATLRVQGHLCPDGRLEASASAHADALARLPLLRGFAPGLSGVFDLSASAERAAGGPLHAQLELTAARPALGATGADSLQVSATGEGENLASARMHAQLNAAQFRYARVRLVEAHLELSADPWHYMARGRFGRQGNLDVRVDRSGESFRAAGGADVALGRGQRLQLDLGRVEYQQRKLTLANLRLSIGKALARVDGWLEPKGRAQLSASVSVPDMAQLTQLVMDEPVGGQLELVAHLEGATRQPRATLKGRYRCHELLGLRDAELDLQARADVPTRNIDIEIEAKARHTALNATIHSELGMAELSQSALERATHDITLEIERIPLNELSMFPTARLRVEAADLSGKLHVRGTLSEPKLSAKVETRARFYGDRSLLTLGLSADYADSQLALHLNAADDQGPLLHSRVKTDLEPRGPLVRTAADFSRLLAQRAWEVELSLRARRVDELPAVHAVAAPKALFPWRLSAHARLEHRPGAEPEGDFQMEALFQPALERENEPKCGAGGAPHLTLEAKMENGALVSHAHVRIASNDLLALEGHSRAPLDQWLGPVSPQPVDITATFDRLRFASLPVLCEQLDGELSGNIKLARAITKKVELTAKLRASKVTWGQAPAFDAWIEAHADREDMIAKVDMNGAGGAATLTAKIPLDANARVPVPRLDAPVLIEARLQEMSVASLLGGIPTISADSGRLDGVVKLSGTLAQPYLNGSLAMREVSLTLGKIGQRFEDVTGQLTLNGRSLHLGQTRVHDRDGRLDVSGDLSMQALDRFHAEFKISAKRYPIRRDGVVLGSYDGKLHVVAQIAPERNVIDLALRDATVELSEDDFGTVQSLKPNREVSFLDARASDPPPENDDSETVVHIDASEPMWIRREDFSAQVSTRMTIVSRGDTPEITGTIEITRGTVELIGQLFDIDRGRIEFSGGHEIEPTLDLVARRKMPGGGTVTVQAQGPLHDPRLTFLVDDKAAPADEAMAALSGGGGAGSASMQDQLSSVATGMAAGVLTMGARRQLGEWVPVLAVESGARETRLRAGVEARRLIPKFMRRLVVDAYVEGMVSSVQDPNETGSDGQASAQTQAAALLELRFPHSLVGEAQYGPGQRWSADLSWEP